MQSWDSRKNSTVIQQKTDALFCHKQSEIGRLFQVVNFIVFLLVIWCLYPAFSQVSSHATLICCHPAHYSPGKTDNMMPHISLTVSQRTKAYLGMVGQKAFGLALESFAQSFLCYCKKKLNFHHSSKIHIYECERNSKNKAKNVWFS